MNYETMTPESLANECFKQSGYAINAQDLTSRINHLINKENSSLVEQRKVLILKYKRMLQSINKAIELHTKEEPRRLQGRASVLELIIKDLQED